MADASYAYVPCRVTLVRSEVTHEFEHDGPCNGVDHAPLPRESETPSGRHAELTTS